MSLKLWLIKGADRILTRLWPPKCSWPSCTRRVVMEPRPLIYCEKHVYQSTLITDKD